MIKIRGRWPRRFRDLGPMDWAAFLLLFGIIGLGGMPILGLQSLAAGRPVWTIGSVRLHLQRGYLCDFTKEQVISLCRNGDASPGWEERRDFEYYVLFRSLRAPARKDGRAVFHTRVKNDKQGGWYGMVSVMSEKICGEFLFMGSRNQAERLVEDLAAQLKRQNVIEIGKEYKDLRRRLLITLPPLEKKTVPETPDDQIDDHRDDLGSYFAAGQRRETGPGF
jgi:hypothetical protein